MVTVPRILSKYHIRCTLSSPFHDNVIPSAILVGVPLPSSLPDRITINPVSIICPPFPTYKLLTSEALVEFVVVL